MPPSPMRAVTSSCPRHVPGLRGMGCRGRTGQSTPKRSAAPPSCTELPPERARSHSQSVSAPLERAHTGREGDAQIRFRAPAQVSRSGHTRQFCDRRDQGDNATLAVTAGHCPPSRGGSCAGRGHGSGVQGAGSPLVTVWRNRVLSLATRTARSSMGWQSGARLRLTRDHAHPGETNRRSRPSEIGSPCVLPNRHATQHRARHPRM